MTVGDRSFAKAGPVSWNALPLLIRTCDILGKLSDIPYRLLCATTAANKVQCEKALQLNLPSFHQMTGKIEFVGYVSLGAVITWPLISRLWASLDLVFGKMFIDMTSHYYYYPHYYRVFEF